jgi:hypothetical protein
VTSQKDQIQALIAEIDGVLQKTTARLPWVMSGEVAQQRQVLEHVRNYLVSSLRRLAIQDTGAAPGSHPDLQAHDIYYQSPSGAISLADSPLPYPGGSMPGEGLAAQQILQTLMQDMTYLRANLMQPLQADLEAMRQQREMLLQDIRQLEMQRQVPGVPALQGNQPQMITEFMQGLVARLQETLPQQIAQKLQASGMQGVAGQPLSSDPGGTLVEARSTGLDPSNADPLVVKLDSTLKVVFESLERNVQAYQESLMQGLERMHGLGQQGEAMFSALVNHLALQLGREASSYLQPENVSQGAIAGSALDAGVYSALPNHPTPPSPSAPNLTPDVSLEQALADLQLPYPGIEIPPNFETSPPLSGSQADVEASTPEAGTTNIEDWLRSPQVSGSGQAEAPGSSQAEPFSPTSWELSEADMQDIDALLQLDAIAPDSPSGASAPASLTAEEDTADIDAALKLLEQLSSELKDDTRLPSLEEAEAEINRMLGSTTPGQEGSPSNYPGTSTDLPEDARDELDEFYEIFGGTEIDTPSAKESASAASSPVSSGEAETATAKQLETAIPTSTDGELQEGQAGELPIDPTLGWDLATDASLTSLEEAIANPQAVTFTQGDLLGELLPQSPGKPSEPEHPATDTVPEPPQQIQSAPPTELPPADVAGPQTAASADTIHSLTDLLPEHPSDEGSPASSVSPSSPVPPATDAETQALFERTLADQQPPIAPVASTPSPQPPAVDSLGEHYPAASPDEDLLPVTPAVDERSPAALWLDETTIDSLNADLSNLEQSSPTPSPAPRQPTPDPANLNLTQEAAIAPVEENYLSLEELAAALPPEPLPSASPPSPTAANAEVPFTLEGMDDLFGDLPPAPPGGTAQSATPTEQPLPFSLEGIGDLFADLPPAPTVSEVPPPVPPTAPSATNANSTQEATSGSLTQPQVSSPLADDPFQAFSLEGMDDLFGDLSSSTPATPPSREPGTSDFTLDSAGELFADVPPAPQAPAGEAPPPSPTDQRSEFSVERVGDVLMEMPTHNLVEPASPSASPEIVPEPTPPAPATFTLEQMGDLFVEVPITGSVPQPTTDVSGSATGDHPNPEGTAAPDMAPSDLNQAFESLLGTPPPAIDTTEKAGEGTQEQEKKKN